VGNDRSCDVNIPARNAVKQTQYRLATGIPEMTLRRYGAYIVIPNYVTFWCVSLLRSGRCAKYDDERDRGTVCGSLRDDISETKFQCMLPVSSMCFDGPSKHILLLWPCLGPPLAALRYVCVYFRFCG